MGAQRSFYDIDPGRDVPRYRGASRRPSEVLSWSLSHLRRDHPIRRFLNDRLQPQHLAIHARVDRFEPSWNRGGPLVVIEGKGVSSLRGRGPGTPRRKMSTAPTKLLVDRVVRFRVRCSTPDR